MKYVKWVGAGFIALGTLLLRIAGFPIAQIRRLISPPPEDDKS